MWKCSTRPPAEADPTAAATATATAARNATAAHLVLCFMLPPRRDGEDPAGLYSRLTRRARTRPERGSSPPGTREYIPRLVTNPHRPSSGRLHRHAHVFETGRRPRRSDVRR